MRRWGSEPLVVRSEVSERHPFNSGGNPSLYPAPDGTVNFHWHDYCKSTNDEQQITSHDGNQWRLKLSGLSSGLLTMGWFDFFQETGPDM